MDLYLGRGCCYPTDLFLWSNLRPPFFDVMFFRWNVLFFWYLYHITTLIKGIFISLSLCSKKQYILVKNALIFCDILTNKEVCPKFLWLQINVTYFMNTSCLYLQLEMNSINYIVVIYTLSFRDKVKHSITKLRESCNCFA